MEKRGVFTKALVTAGTVLIWFPILITIGISLAAFITERLLRFDYLMPAEFFPVAFVGGGLLFGVALWTRSRRALIGWGLGAMLAFLGGVQAFAELTGLASGRTEPVGWVWVVAIGLLILYSLSLIEVGVAGILLWRDFFRRSDRGGASGVT